MKATKKLIVIFIGISICVLLLLLLLSKQNQESFQTISPVTYSSSTVTNYNNYQNSNKQLAVAQLQQLGVPESDVNSYISSGTWPWSSEFTAAMNQLLINIPDMDSTTQTSVIANMQSQVPENFYIELVSASYSADFVTIAESYKISCNIDSTTKQSTGDTLYTMDDNGNITSTSVANAQLPTTIPGFMFLDQPCNPCNLINNDFSCPFVYPDSTGKPVYQGPILDYLWGITISNDNSNNTTTSLGGSVDSIVTDMSQMYKKYVG